jgi:hypothetical protein
LGKGADEAGLTAELLRGSPFLFSNTLPKIISKHFLGQYVRCFWHVTFFEMFATKIAQVDPQTSGLLPASIFPIKLIIFFAYMLFDRIKAFFERRTT